MAISAGVRRAMSVWHIRRSNNIDKVRGLWVSTSAYRIVSEIQSTEHSSLAGHIPIDTIDINIIGVGPTVNHPLGKSIRRRRQ